MHAVHATDEYDQGEAESNDPLTQASINAAVAVREDLVSVLGTDLTIQDNTNPLFHTGGTPNMVRATSSLTHRPWEHAWHVAQGTRAFTGNRPKSWKVKVDRFLREKLFTAAAYK